MKSKEARNSTRRLMLHIGQSLVVIALCELCDRAFSGKDGDAFQLIGELNFYDCVYVELDLYDCVYDAPGHQHIVCDDCREVYEKARVTI